jgi:hypothetical protein
MIELSVIRDLVAIFSFIIGLTYYIMNLKNQEKIRHASLFMNVYQTMNTDMGMESDIKIGEIKYKTHKDWEKIASDPELFKCYAWQGNLHESLGVLVRDGLIDIGMLARLHSGSILFFWDRFCEGILDSREAMGWPRWMVETEYLYNRLVDYSNKHPELEIKTPTQFATEK